MLTIILSFHLGMLSNPYYMAGIYYVLGMCLQTLITSHFTRIRYEVLINEYNHTKGSIWKLKILSVLFWPISMWLGVRSLYERLKTYRRRNDINSVEEED